MEKKESYMKVKFVNDGLNFNVAPEIPGQHFTNNIGHSTACCKFLIVLRCVIIGVVTAPAGTGARLSWVPQP